jgi:hypothetical protein
MVRTHTVFGYKVGEVDKNASTTIMQPYDLFKRKITLSTDCVSREPAYVVSSICCRPYCLQETNFLHYMFLVTWEGSRVRSWVPEVNLITVDRSLIALAKKNIGKECYIVGQSGTIMSDSDYEAPSVPIAFQELVFCALNSMRNAVDILGDNESLSDSMVARMRTLGPYTAPNFLVQVFNSNPKRHWTWRRVPLKKGTVTFLFSLRFVCLVVRLGHCALVDCRDEGRVVFIDPSPCYPAPIVVQAADLVALNFGTLDMLYWLHPYVPSRVSSSRARKKRRRH